MGIFFMFFPAYGAEYGFVPYKLQAALFFKILNFHNGVNQGKDVVIHVVDNPEFAGEMKTYIGKKIGKSTLTRVTEGDRFAGKIPSVVYVGRKENIEPILEFTRAHSILSITGHPGLLKKGVTMGIGEHEKKPRILLNIESSKKEGVNWNPVIIKISKIIE